MNKTNRPKKTTEAESLLSHLIELRDRLIRAMLGILLVFICLAPFANELYSILAGPLTKSLPQGSSMIAIDVAAPFLIPFKLTMMLALVLSIPWVLYQAWGFIAPGLYRHERKLVLPLIASTTLLFYSGMAFAYFVVFPLMFSFFSGTAPEGVAVMTDIGRYLDFVLGLFLAFGVAFEVPVATVILVYFGITTPDDLTSKRPYVIVGAFVIGMFLTPPDVFSQTLLAVPMWMLFEVGIVFSRIVSRRKHEREAQEETQYGTLSENNPDRVSTPTVGKRKS